MPLDPRQRHDWEPLPEQQAHRCRRCGFTASDVHWRFLRGTAYCHAAPRVPHRMEALLEGYYCLGCGLRLADGLQPESECEGARGHEWHRYGGGPPIQCRRCRLTPVQVRDVCTGNRGHEFRWDFTAAMSMVRCRTCFARPEVAAEHGAAACSQRAMVANATSITPVPDNEACGNCGVPRDTHLGPQDALRGRPHSVWGDLDGCRVFVRSGRAAYGSLAGPPSELLRDIPVHVSPANTDLRERAEPGRRAIRLARTPATNIIAADGGRDDEGE